MITRFRYQQSWSTKVECPVFRLLSFESQIAVDIAFNPFHPKITLIIFAPIRAKIFSSSPLLFSQRWEEGQFWVSRHLHIFKSLLTTVSQLFLWGKNQGAPDRLRNPDKSLCRRSLASNSSEAAARPTNQAVFRFDHVARIWRYI